MTIELRDPDGRQDRPPSRSRFGTPVLTSVPAVTALLVGAVGLDNRQLWLDELATWWATKIPTADFARLMAGTDVVLLPYYLLMRGWVTLFGDSAVALRVPALMTMALAAALVAALGRRLISPRVGLIAGLLFALLPGVSRYAQEARPYAFVVAGAAGATLLLLRATDRPTRTRWLAFAAVAAVAVALHLLVAGVLLAHAGWALRRRQLARFLIAATPAAAVFVGLGTLAYDQRVQVEWIDSNWLSIFVRLGEIFFSYLLPVPFLVMAISAVVRHRRRQPDEMVLLAVWAWAPILLLYLIHPVLDLFIARYVLFTLPAWAILIAVRLDDLGRWLAHRMRPRLAGIAIAIGLAVLVALAVPGHRDARIDLTWQADYRSLTKIVAAEAQAGDGMGFQDWYGRLSFAYHLPTAPQDIYLHKHPYLGTYAPEECVTSCAGGTERIWFVTQAPKDSLFDDVPVAKASELRDHYHVAQVHQANLVTLALLIRN